MFQNFRTEKARVPRHLLFNNRMGLNLILDSNFGLVNFIDAVDDFDEFFVTDIANGQLAVIGEARSRVDAELNISRQRLRLARTFF